MSICTSIIETPRMLWPMTYRYDFVSGIEEPAGPEAAQDRLAGDTVHLAGDGHDGERVRRRSGREWALRDIQTTREEQSTCVT